MFRTFIFIMTTLLFSSVYADTRPGKLPEGVNPGSLEVLQLDGKKPDAKLEMPLQHTSVEIEISGFVASAKVTQRYRNLFTKPIEAVYTFPLPEDAAVDDMEMTVGKRTIKGIIKQRDEARKIYEQARDQGQRASLLEQERPNIFTQSVANIMPGEDIIVTIRYVDILRYSEGNYELVFPMVVGPRYIPGQTATGRQGTGWAADTNVVSDASKITPPVLKPGERSGHDIAVSVKLDAGVPIRNLNSPSHVIDSRTLSSHQSELQLHPADTIPNKDFILRYQVAGKAPEMAVIAHHDERGGFFTLMIQPQQNVDETEIVPRELIFIVDTSGSMNGFPIEKSKEAMRKLIKGMRPTDTFNVVRFAGDTGTLWDKPQRYTAARAIEALDYVELLKGSGGTEMRQGILEALAQPAADDYLRIAFLLTDGYVGDEFRILQTIEKERRGARIFTLGVGSAVNRYLLGRAADVGRGEAFYVRQDEDSSAVIDQFFKRVDKPTLAHLSIDWKSLDVEQLYPPQIPDLWAGQPLRVHGRYRRGGQENIVVQGQFGKRNYEQIVPVALPQNAPAHATMATVWARQKVKQLMANMVEQGQTKALVEEATQVGLAFRLMTQWTSFVAVEEKVVNVEGKPQTVVQPVEMPQGVSYEGIFGGETMNEADMAAGGKFLGDARGAGGIALRMKPAVPSAPITIEEQKMLVPMPMEEADKPKTGKENANEEGIKRLLKNIHFEEGKAVLTSESKYVLKKLAAKICEQLGDIEKVIITGYTDDSAADDNKEKLSLERATVVADYLTSQCQTLTDKKLTVKGEADRKPIASSETAGGRAQNRRVEIEIKMR